MVSVGHPSRVISSHQYGPPKRERGGEGNLELAISGSISVVISAHLYGPPEQEGVPDHRDEKVNSGEAPIVSLAQRLPPLHHVERFRLHVPVGKAMRRGEHLHAAGHAADGHVERVRTGSPTRGARCTRARGRARGTRTRTRAPRRSAGSQAGTGCMPRTCMH